MLSGLCPGTPPTGQLAISPVGDLIDYDSVNVFNPILNSHHVVTSSTVCVAWKTFFSFVPCLLSAYLDPGYFLHLLLYRKEGTHQLVQMWSGV